jgi:hypothetical protein
MLRQLFGGPLLTFAVLATALGVSYARRRDEKRRQQQAQGDGDAARGESAAATAPAGTGKYFAVLSAEALKLLVRVVDLIAEKQPAHGSVRMRS